MFITQLFGGANCIPTYKPFNFKVSNFRHISLDGVKNYNFDNGKVSSKLPFWRYPDDVIYKTGDYIDIKKIFANPYGKRGPDNFDNAFYYVEWWTEVSSNYNCASFNSNSLSVNSNGTLQGKVDASCPGASRQLTVDIVSQCHKANTLHNSTSIGFWWKSESIVNPNSLSNVVAMPVYQDTTSGCILNNTPYGCNTGNNK